MVRKLFSGITLAAALVVAVGCSSSSSVPTKTAEQLKAEQEKMIPKGMGPGTALPSASGK